MLGGNLEDFKVGAGDIESEGNIKKSTVKKLMDSAFDACYGWHITPRSEAELEIIMQKLEDAIAGCLKEMGKGERKCG